MHIPWRLPLRTALRPQNGTCASSTVTRIATSPSTSIPRQRFSTSPILAKRKGPQERDGRVSLIRYFLFKQRNPRPLRFSRHRYLRHWTIHRAWMLHKRKTRDAQRMDLERQYWAMNRACEELRLIGDDGLKVGEVSELVSRNPGLLEDVKGVEMAEEGKNIGRLFRTAMRKEGVWQGAPIEYARLQTEWPAKSGWNHEWKRAG